MKKLFFLMAAAAALFTSCSKDDTIGGLSRGKVTFEVSTPELATRYGEGTTATALQYAVYDMIEDTTNGKLVDTGSATLNNKAANVAIDLVEGRKYSVIFWADAGQNSPYNFDEETKTVSYKNTSALQANQESYDAFFAYVPKEQVKVGETVTVSLKRPFAQLRIETSDKDRAAKLGVNVEKTGITVNAYTSFNLETGAVNGKQELTFEPTTAASATTTVDGTKYDLISMNYLLVNGKETVDVTLNFTDKISDTQEETYIRKYNKIDVQRNYRTLVRGTILTDPTNFDVTVSEGFAGDHTASGDNSATQVVSNAQEIQAAIDNAPDGTPTTIILTDDLNLNSTTIIENTSTQLTTRAEADPTLKIGANKIITLDLNGKTLSATSSQTGKNYNMFYINKGTLTVKNGTIEYKHTGDNMGWSNSTNIFHIENATLNLNSVTAKNLGGSDMAFVAHLNNWGEVTLNVDNSTLESTYIAVRAFNSGNDMNNITIKNSTLNGKYCFWVHNYKAAGDNNGDDSTLNVDIYGNNNTFTYTGTAPVLYGFANPLYFDAKGRQIAVDAEMLLSALTNATEDITIYLANDITADKAIVIKENTNVKFTIDGDDHTFNGAFMIYGNSNGDDSKGILIKNINFESSVAKFADKNGKEADAFVWSNDTTNGSYWRYANDVTIENCTFTATAGSAAEKVIVGVKFQQAYNIKVVNCTATNLHSLMQAESCDSTVTVEDCKVVNGKNGVSFNNTMNAIIKDTKIEAVVDGSYGVRHKGECANYALTVENCDIKAFVPVLIRNMTATGYTATLNGENTLTANSSNIHQIVLSKGDFDEKTALVAPTGSYTLTGAEGFKVYPRDYIDLSQTITGEINA